MSDPHDETDRPSPPLTATGLPVRVRPASTHPQIRHAIRSMRVHTHGQSQVAAVSPNLAESLSDTTPSAREGQHALPTLERERVPAGPRAPAGMLTGLPPALGRHVETRESQLGSSVVLDAPCNPKMAGTCLGPFWSRRFACCRLTRTTTK